MGKGGVFEGVGVFFRGCGNANMMSVMLAGWLGMLFSFPRFLTGEGVIWPFVGR